MNEVPECDPLGRDESHDKGGDSADVSFRRHRLGVPTRTEITYQGSAEHAEPPNWNAYLEHPGRSRHEYQRGREDVH